MKKPELSMEIDTTRSMVTFFNVNVEDGMRLKEVYAQMLDERGLRPCSWCNWPFKPEMMGDRFCSEEHRDLYLTEVLAG